MSRKKKARSRGQIQSRGSGKYLVRIYLGQDEATGKRSYSSKTVNGSKRDAEKELTAMLAEADQGVYVAPSKGTLRDFLDSWLDTKSASLSGTGARDYRTRMELDVFPFIGAKKLDSVTPMDINRLYNTTLLEERKLSGRTIEYTHAILRQALGDAVEWGILTQNPCRKRAVKLPKTEKTEMKVLSPEQVQLFLERASGTRLYPLWVLFLTTGMRPGEALALKWSDLEEPHVIIRRTIRRTRENGYKVVNETKTDKSRRMVSLPETTLRVLREHRIRQLEEALKEGPRYDRSGEWIFATKTGRFYAPGYISTEWAKALKRAGMPSLRLYDTRHTHITTLLMQGISAKVVAERVGHSTTKHTLDTYAHVAQEIHDKTAQDVERVFFGGPKEARG